MKPSASVLVWLLVTLMASTACTRWESTQSDLELQTAPLVTPGDAGTVPATQGIQELTIAPVVPTPMATSEILSTPIPNVSPSVTWPWPSISAEESLANTGVTESAMQKSAEPLMTPPVPTPETDNPSLATPSPAATLEWGDYTNEFFGYRFSHPVEARISTQGVTGFPFVELPENLTSEAYWEQLETTYPDNLCVSVRYKTGFVTFVPDDDKGGKYTVPCGITGVGDYDIIDVTETILIDGQSLTAFGSKLYGRGDPNSWQGEFYMVRADDTVTIHYGSLRGSEEQFLDIQDILRQIVTSYVSRLELPPFSGQ